MRKNGKNNRNNKADADVIEGEIIEKDTPVDKSADTSASSQESDKKEAVTDVKKSEDTSDNAGNSDNKPAKQSSGAAGKLALLLAIIAVIGVGYLYWLQLESKNSIATSQAEASSALDGKLQASQQQQNAKVSNLGQQIQALESKAKADAANIDELQARLTRSIQQITATQQNTRKDWIIAEAEYLLRLANQRVLMEQTPQGALKLLRSADKILKETDDVTIYAVRKALASDIAALEAVPELDTEGLFLRLGALNEQVNNLKLIPLTEQHKLPEIVSEVSDETFTETWTANLQKAWAKIADKFNQLVVIQDRDAPVEPLLSPQQNFYLQQNLHLMLEQAQLSLLQRRSGTYENSLSKAEGWVGTYFEASDSTTQALIRSLQELKQVNVAPVLPDISGSLNALKKYLQEMRKLKEQEAA
ncbi:uroporphyrinogen-III C-methyltransferase [Aliamphritea spongicola]|uniref:uroporphyrinogen-III C-methyltransferase n=1 Tax=Aliamphritea spongicola TaxID=707589 RepID=UPI00196AB6CA|nr:uroporphyrinogen-III C-methyltransferase [Aliamphritea spongicola]MBN3564634.1 uroporphyrinogen-III C-methyltransferase [Aliamphritea spongicola]